ncbi:MAG: DoxX family protein [Armatimonadota bacterium]
MSSEVHAPAAVPPRAHREDARPAERSETSLYDRIICWHAAFAPLGSLLARIALGVVFVAHGSQKLFGAFGGHGPSGTIAFMHDSLGIPAFLAVLAMVTEFFGGLAVLVGLFTRLAALGITCVMAVAVFKVHLSSGFFSQAGGFEYPFALGLLALALVFGGAGKWSLDAWLGCWWGGSRRLPADGQ